MGAGYVVTLIAWCEYMGGTCGSGVVSGAYEMLDMSVVRG